MTPTGTRTAAAHTLTALTPALIRVRLAESVDKKFDGGVIGVRARPVWDGPEQFDYRGSPVTVAACPSALAVREALSTWDGNGWLVIITDRTGEDLGDGILAHLIGSRVRTPDEWEALRQQFRASSIAPVLRAQPDSRSLARGLLTAEPDDGWTPAPGGVLSLDHAMAAVFRTHLTDADSTTIDAVTVLRWTAGRGAAPAVADLRQLAGDALTDAVLGWLASQLGLAAGPVRALLSAGKFADVVPLGVVAGLITAGGLDAEDARIAELVRTRMEAPLSGESFSTDVLTAWGTETRAIDPTPAALEQADSWLAQLRGEQLAERSGLLPSGLHARLGTLAQALRASVGDVPDGAGPAAADQPQISAARLGVVEAAWEHVGQHRAVREIFRRGDRDSSDRRTIAFHSAVRLARWLATPSTADGAAMPALVARHRDTDAWVDVAINKAAEGVSDSDHATALEAVLRLAQYRRDQHDMVFAATLAALTHDDPADPGVRYIEDVLGKDLAPLVTSGKPVLLLVLDGMSMAAAIEIVADATMHGWMEWSTGPQRGVALATLPTVTNVSRVSLLTGSLTSGGQADETKGLAEFGRSHGFGRGAGISGRKANKQAASGTALFHKKPLESTPMGFAVSREVAVAIDDTRGLPLVTCVLNTIDDALDRSDPGGTDWTLTAVRHLKPLLERARVAGRMVVITSDHGHVIERRDSEQRAYPGVSTNRWRPAPGAAASAGMSGARETARDDEVLVEGRRVVTDSGSAILAVNKRLRYGAIKAGYHGGATPDEVLVPVSYLVSGIAAEGITDRLTPVGELAPDWWNAPLPVVGSAQQGAATLSVASGGAEPAVQGRRRRKAAATDQTQGSLPGLELPEPPLSDAGPAAPVANPHDALADSVLASETYAEQVKRAGRAAPDSGQVRATLIGLLAAPGNRHTLLSLPRAGNASRARGLFAVLQRLFNVEGYQVISLDADGISVVLDVGLLKEQFGID